MLDTYDPQIGYRVAERMGLEISRPLGLFGGDGHVYSLMDGRVLKVSFQDQEYAVSRILLNLAEKGNLPDFLPEIYDVIIDPVETQRNQRVYTIIREDVVDFTPSCDAEDWQDIMDKFTAIWSFRPHAMKAFLKEYDKTPEICQPLREIHNIATTLLKTYGVKVHDLKDENIGVLSNGHLTIRDMGQCEISSWALKAVQETDFPYEEPSVSCTF